MKYLKGKFTNVCNIVEKRYCDRHRNLRVWKAHVNHVS